MRRPAARHGSVNKDHPDDPTRASISIHRTDVETPGDATRNLQTADCGQPRADEADDVAAALKRLPTPIQAFLNQHASLRAGSESTRAHLSKLEDYAIFLTKSGGTTDASQLKDQLRTAHELAEAARFPDQSHPSKSYKTFQQGMNPLLQDELKVIAALPGFIGSLRKEPGGQTKLAACSLADLCNLYRTSMTARDASSSLDIPAQSKSPKNVESTTAVPDNPTPPSQVTSATTPPIWAQGLPGSFADLGNDHASSLHAQSNLSMVRKTFDELHRYQKRLKDAVCHDADEFNRLGKKETEVLKSYRKNLNKSQNHPELAAALIKAIDQEIAVWDRMAYMLVQAENRRDDAAIGKVSVSEWLTIGRTRLTKEKSTAQIDRYGGIQPEDLLELMDARSSFAPDLSVDHFLAIKQFYIPVNAATIPDAKLSADIGTLQLSEVGSGQMGTVWKATIKDPQGREVTWVLKAEDEALFPSSSAIDIGVPQYTRSNGTGPNLTGRTVASSKAAARLGTGLAPVSCPVVFVDPQTGKPVYGAASHFVQGDMLQSAPGKTAQYRPDHKTAQVLAGLGKDERQTLMTRLGKAMGFESVSFDTSEGCWLLRPNPHQPYLRALNWNDAVLRQSASDGGVWAAKTAQADNHAGNYMVVQRPGHHTSINSIDNDQSMGRIPVHPMQVGCEPVQQDPYLDDWIKYLKDTEDKVTRPSTMSQQTRDEWLSKGIQGLRADPTFKIDGANYKVNFRQMAKLTKLMSDLKAGSEATQPIQVTSLWARRMTMSGPSTKSSGIPTVMTRSAAEKLLKMTEADVRLDLAGLSRAEQDAEWARTQVLQTMLQRKDILAMDENKQDEWEGEAMAQRMGIDTPTLQAIAKADLAPGVQGTPAGDKHRMTFGLAAALALEDAMAREAVAQRLRGDDHDVKASALFDPALLDQLVTEEAGKLQAASPIKV